MVSSHRILNDCTVPLSLFQLQNLIEVHDGFVSVADLEIFKDHPCDLVSREKASLFVWSYFLNEVSLFF